MAAINVKHAVLSNLCMLKKWSLDTNTQSYRLPNGGSSLYRVTSDHKLISAKQTLGRAFWILSENVGRRCYWALSPNLARAVFRLINMSRGTCLVEVELQTTNSEKKHSCMPGLRQKHITHMQLTPLCENPCDLQVHVIPEARSQPMSMHRFQMQCRVKHSFCFVSLD